ncbi:MAG: DNA repair protein RadA [Pseudomonadota bacterium]
MRAQGRRLNTVFICQHCGFRSPKWLGRCPECNSWDSLAEEACRPRGGSPSGAAENCPAVPLSAIALGGEARLPTGSTELDRVLGGGIVAGSVVLVGGDPGIGKSTLILQLFTALAAAGGRVLYVSGEESPAQIKLRARRLGSADSSMLLAAETSLERVAELVSRVDPQALCVDSIQTLFTADIDSAPGTVSQVRECAARLTILAKQRGMPLFLVGHTTKEGAIAGPRLLEHVVDCVLYFEGDRGHAFRILRAVKNRFGSTNEIGVFEMQAAGLVEVTNPSALFLSERQGSAGSVVTAALEGTRPLLLEMQALVARCAFGLPRRTAVGIEGGRLLLLLAVLEKKVGLNLSGHDCYLSVAGGVRVAETAVDLGAALALASSLLEKPLGQDTVIFGEVGLGGEVRAVGQAELRLAEAAKLGFTRCLLPAANLKRLSGRPPKGLEVRGVATVEAALEVLE